jgi:hypothetical protein
MPPRIVALIPDALAPFQREKNTAVRLARMPLRAAVPANVVRVLIRSAQAQWPPRNTTIELLKRVPMAGNCNRWHVTLRALRPLRFKI